MVMASRFREENLKLFKRSHITNTYNATNTHRRLLHWQAATSAYSCRARHQRHWQIRSRAQSAAPWAARSSTGLTLEIEWRSSWWSWSIDAWTVGQLSTSAFTASHCPARDSSAKSTARITSPCGRRAFAIAGPFAWNSRTDPVRNPSSTEAVFRRLLKTFLFARY